MNFALLGDDLRTLPLARAIAAAAHHQLSSTALAARCHAALCAEYPSLRACRSWEDLLADPDLDAVIVSGDDDRILAAARQLSAAGKSLILLPTPDQSSALLYELTLIQTDAAIHLVPLLALRAHPLVQKLQHLMQSGGFGTIHHVQIERRSVPAQPGAGAPLLSADQLRTCLLEDVDLLRCLGGDYDQVTASRSGDATRGVSLATVMLAGSASPPAVWSATATRLEEAWHLTVAGERGTALLSGDPARLEFRFESRLMEGPEHAGHREDLASAEPPEEGNSSAHATVHVDPGAWQLEHTESMFAGRHVRPDWTDLTRAFELLDAVDRSVRRRRTIDLHYEAPSERNVFKTQMTAVGCSLLVLTLVATIAYLVLAAMFDLNATVKHVARFLIFLPLGVFLVLQMLLFLTKPANRER